MELRQELEALQCELHRAEDFELALYSLLGYVKGFIASTREKIIDKGLELNAKRQTIVVTAIQSPQESKGDE